MFYHIDTIITNVLRRHFVYIIRIIVHNIVSCLSTITVPIYKPWTFLPHNCISHRDTIARTDKSKEVLHARRKHLHARPSRLLLSHIRFVMRSRPSRCLLPFPSLSPYLHHHLVDNHYYSVSLLFIIFYYVSGMRRGIHRRCVLQSKSSKHGSLVKEKKLILGENKTKKRNHLRERVN